MNDKDKAKRAFPVVHDTGRGLVCVDQGMTLRDWFAGQALAGLLAADWEPQPGRTYADVAYANADQMMKARDAG